MVKSTTIFIEPRSYKNVVWLEDARTDRHSRCKKCKGGERCTKCRNRFDGEVFLVNSIPPETIRFAQKKLKCVTFGDLQESLRYIDIDASFEIFTQKRILYIAALKDSYHTIKAPFTL